MRTRLTFAVVVLGMLASEGVQAVALAQARPDFSGTWSFNQAASDAGTAGNSPIVPFPSVIVVKQTATELHVASTSVRQSPITAAYTLDGGTVTVEAAQGITETGTARLEGDTVVITAHRSYPSPAGDIVAEFTETWSLSGSVLTIEKTRTQDGEANTRTAVFDKQ